MEKHFKELKELIETHEKELAEKHEKELAEALENLKLERSHRERLEVELGSLRLQVAQLELVVKELRGAAPQVQRDSEQCNDHSKEIAALQAQPDKEQQNCEKSDDQSREIAEIQAQLKNERQKDEQVAEPHRSIEAALVNQICTSQRDVNLLSSKHSIFLSHSGVQKSFVDQLCLDIERRDRYPFFDKRRDSLAIGDDFPRLIFEAIDQCQVGVVVLSEEFFSRSKWPMLELAAMVKRKARDPKFVIMPVFLGVSHTQCRDKVNQARWLSIWQGWARVDKRIMVLEWEEALRVFGYTNGISLNDGLDEVKCREEIVDAVCNKIRPNTRWDDSHVQGRSRMSLLICAKVERVEVSKSYGIRVLGIYGTGGMGKTTICKVLRNEYFAEFEGRVCHIEFGVGHGMLQMLQEVLKRLTDTNQELIGGFSVDECIGRLKQDLTKKVFLAIDNVSDTQEIVDNAKEILRLGFREGSIVIVTARSHAQLQNLNLEDCMRMPELEKENARSLFLHHAAPGLYLKSVHGINEGVLERCIQRCYFRKGKGMQYHYHPLALKVLGMQLGNKPDEWMKKLDLYEGDPFNQYGEKEKKHPIFSILETSFELLKYEDQLLFMDVAIFFPTFQYASIFDWLSMTHGKSIGEIMQRLEGLKRKSLVEDWGDGRRIALHDLWVEFAGMKAKGRECDQRPWIKETVYVLDDPRREESVLCGGGWMNLQRISMVGKERRNSVAKELSLSRCSNLRVLKLEDVTIETEVLDLRSLTQLKSLQFSQDLLGNTEVYFLGLGCLENLAYLQLYYICTDMALLQGEIASLSNLQVLDVHKVSHKTRSGRLTLEQEERSTLQKWGGEGSSVDCRRHGRRRRATGDGRTGDAGGGTLERANGESGNLAGADQQPLAKGTGNPTRKDSPQVEWASARNVWAAQPVSSSLDLSRMNLLRAVRLISCRQGVDMISGLNSRMTRLKQLELRGCSSLRSCLGVGDLVALEELDLTGCCKLKRVPNLGRLKNLLILRVSECSLIETVPGLGDLVSLLEFRACGCSKLAELPDMRKLVNLRTLDVGGCPLIKAMPGLRKLVNLRTLDVGGCPLIKAMPGLSYLIGLKALITDVPLRGCHDLRKLKKLEWVTIRGDISCLSYLRSVNYLQIGDGEGVDELTFVSKPTRLQMIEFSVTGVPFNNLSGMTVFSCISVRNCNQLERLPDMHKLSRLFRLDIDSCKNLREWDSGSELRQFGECGHGAGALLHAWILVLRSVAFTELPDLSRFPQLRRLEVYDCEKLTSLTSSAPLTALQILSLEKCGVVRALKAQLDLSDLVSPISLKLWRFGSLQLIEELVWNWVRCWATCNTWRLRAMNTRDS